jgi:hypothetical protein
MGYEVVRSRLEYDGALVRVRVDTVVQPDGFWAEREVVEHVASVAIVAIDDQQRVLLIRQYRHPAGHYLRELPAGLCDKPGEPPLGAAQRELAEEAQLRAAAWRTLADLRPSPGISTEVCRDTRQSSCTPRSRRPPGRMKKANSGRAGCAAAGRERSAHRAHYQRPGCRRAARRRSRHRRRPGMDPAC